VRERVRRTGEAVDRVGGKLYYRTMGFVAGLLGLVSGLAAIRIVQGDGPSSRFLAAAIFGVAAVGCYFLTRYCFSPDRRLTDLDA
jgi:hypothetical protein